MVGRGAGREFGVPVGRRKEGADAGGGAGGGRWCGGVGSVVGRYPWSWVRARRMPRGLAHGPVLTGLRGGFSVAVLVGALENSVVG
jgi:hypothetical protein